MKILVLSNNDGGLWHFRQELLRTLIADNELFVCTPTGDYSKSIESLGCTFISCTKLSRRGMNPIQDLKLFLFYFNLCSKLHPYLVLTYTIKPNVYGGMACSSYGVPYIANITGLGTAVENDSFMQKIAIIWNKY